MWVSAFGSGVTTPNQLLQAGAVFSWGSPSCRIKVTDVNSCLLMQSIDSALKTKQAKSRFVR